tara:strand:+ start:3819 stop:4790 length:972 start_codon:yes stop_codon:yes gene_type:complete
MSLLDNTAEWAARHGYFHHSNPSVGDALTFWDKGIKRPRLRKAYAILKGEVKGDRELAQKTVNEYQSLNVKMLAGTIVQDICDTHLIDEKPYNECLKSGFKKLRKYNIPEWRDKEKERSELEHREKILYALKEVKGEKVWKKSNDDATHCELDLVAQHAIEGLKEAQNKHGLNQLEPEVDLYSKLPKCELYYNGKPDYSSRIELKTQWDSNVHISARVNSLPNEVKANHMTQIAGYWYMTGNLPSIVYANRMGYKIFSPTEDELQQALQYIIESCQRRERLLKVASTTEELLRLCDPQWGGLFGWKDMNPTVLENARKIWRIE